MVQNPPLLYHGYDACPLEAASYNRHKDAKDMHHNPLYLDMHVPRIHIRLNLLPIVYLYSFSHKNMVHQIQLCLFYIHCIFELSYQIDS